MRTADFDYVLPPELIAAAPAEPRDASRLLVLRRATGAVEHRRFSDILEYLRPGDCLAVNDSRVIPARLIGERAGGGRAEIFLLEPRGEGRWLALAKPGRKLEPGQRVKIAGGAAAGGADIEIEEALPEGERIVRIDSPAPLEALLERHGHIPLPPYILAARKERGLAPEDAADRARYQTVYARPAGSVAAPTAGLHFTPELLARAQTAGAELRRTTLHVGPGTFAPVKAEDPRKHPMHRERWSISPEDAAGLEAARADHARRIIAVGTTVVRTLESCAAERGAIAPGEGSTDLLILPGYRFRAVDALVTNFHLPRSTLLMLVAAFAGREATLAAYAEAVREGYRFYSYGDAMLIL